MLNDSIRVFLTVAEKKNFSHAAKALSLTQPAVSFQIQTLEQYYGTILFDRVNRNITLTAAGELLKEYALHMNKLQSELEREMQKLTGKVKGELQIGASTTIGEYILPRLIGSFKKKYPEVMVSLEINNTLEIAKSVLENSLDIALVEGPVTNSNLIVEDFLDDELVLIVPPTHPWANREEISIEELKEYPFISREKGSGTRSVTEKAFKKIDFPLTNLKINMELGSTTAIKAAVINGLGVAIVSKYAVAEDVRLGKLVVVPIKEIKFKRKFIIIYREGKFQTQAANKFLQYLETQKEYI